MIYRIVNKGKKFAYQVKNREDFLALRNSKKNLDNLAKARKGDEKAKAIIDKMAKDLATCLSAIAAICAPDCFVIGGGCSNSSVMYFEQVRNYYRSMVHPTMGEVPILKASLAEPGVLGAAMIGKSHLN